MKTSALYSITIVLLLSLLSGCANRIPAQSDNVVKTVYPLTTNSDLKAKTNLDEKDEWKAYRSILSGDFSLINDDDYKSEMEYLYKIDTQNEKCEWKYIFMDFNNDGVDELFIQLTPDHDSALFGCEDGNIECIYIDDLEINCFAQPLKGGKLLETYNYWIAPTKTVFEVNAEFNFVNPKQYFSINVDDYKYFMENYGDILDQYPLITKEGEYYFQEIYGKTTELSKEDWERIQKDINEQIVSDSEWKNCSELRTN